MKSKGYTLIELVGVIVILALILLLVLPSIIGVIKKSNDEKDELIYDLIYNAADIHISRNVNDYPKKNGNVYCILVSDLENPEYLDLSNSEINFDNKVVKVTVTTDYNYEIVESNQCTVKNN